MYYFITLAIVAYLVVNLPLFFTCKDHWADKKILFKIIAQNPHQYLFLLLFFLVAVVVLSYAGISFIVFMDGSTERTLSSFRSGYEKWFSILIIILVFPSFLVAYLSKISTPPEIPGFKKEYAHKAIIAYSKVLETMEANTPISEIKEDLLSLKSWLGVVGGWEDVFKENKTENLLRKVSRITHGKITQIIQNPSDGKIHELISSSKEALSKHLFKAIPYLQVFLDKNYLKSSMDMNTSFDPVDKKNRFLNVLEEFVDFFVVFNFIVLLLGLIYINRSIGSSADEIVKITYLLLGFVFMFLIWSVLRTISLKEQSLVFGGKSDSMLPVYLTWFFACPLIVYLLLIAFNFKDIKFIFYLVPMLFTIAIGILGIKKPLLISGIIGTLSNWAYYLIFVIIVFIVNLLGFAFLWFGK